MASRKVFSMTTFMLRLLMVRQRAGTHMPYTSLGPVVMAAQDLGGVTKGEGVMGMYVMQTVIPPVQPRSIKKMSICQNTTGRLLEVGDQGLRQEDVGTETVPITLSIISVKTIVVVTPVPGTDNYPGGRRNRGHFLRPNALVTRAAHTALDDQ